MSRIFTCFVLLLTSTVSFAATSQCYTGYAYHKNSDTLAFTARYTPTGESENRSKTWVVNYRAPDSTLLATKHLDFSHNPYVPVYTQKFADSGNMAGIRRDNQGQWVMVERKGENGSLNSKTFELSPPMASDNGIHPFIQAHFDALLAGETLRFKLPLAPRQRVVEMRIDRIENTNIDGTTAVRFRAKVDNLFVGWFTQKLEFSYHPQTKHLLAFKGVSNMQDERGEPYPVRIRYYRGDAPASLPDLGDC